ncbi:traB domain-containing protein isoform X2 [Belonocnema kinseyi]|uniref:traB domain-containing protein isoform X2 n=1 Tax=Belonocnema kinseyi TaxID=2817044 RepID=UPI00143D1D0E|nr:traB domain-containing protein isoform X2 [Belonocnema kinseyi]
MPARDRKRRKYAKFQESIGSGLESDVEDNVSDTGATNEVHKIEKYDSTIDDNLPPTVTLLTTPEGGKLYLIGTAHFSVESQNDVSKIIRAVQPSIVMIELCKHRIHALHLDEEALLKQSENIGIEDIRAAIKKHGVTSGLMFIVLLSMSRHVTKELGMAPGSEFRTAFVEAAKIPNCIVHLGDRPFNITMQRAFRSLSLWQKLKCAWKLLSSREPITKEDVEKCKNRETLDAVIEELSAEFPPLAEVMVKERDLFLTYSLQLACQPRMTHEGVIVPTRAVGVVGIGHMPGIIKNWGKVHASEILPIMKVPPRALSSKIIGFTIKASLIGAVLYVGYRTIPLPSTETIESLKSSVKGLVKRLGTCFSSSVDLQSR